MLQDLSVGYQTFFDIAMDSELTMTKCIITASTITIVNQLVGLRPSNLERYTRYQQRCNRIRQIRTLMIRHASKHRNQHFLQLIEQTLILNSPALSLSHSTSSRKQSTNNRCTLRHILIPDPTFHPIRNRQLTIRKIKISIVVPLGQGDGVAETGEGSGGGRGKVKIVSGFYDVCVFDDVDGGYGEEVGEG